MMADYDNTNRGTLGKNKRREKDSHPAYTGSINVDGVEYWLSGWVKEKNDEKFFSLSIKPKDAAPAKAAPKQAPADLDDEIPF
ncbi:hypothetical protein CU669_15215 [Paramagnetospirillum kuznetsovii]|uniref:DUF736 domain-containing protein n=1 Tax=Paramagnetospirillum kuznetsovii TaxID=2053833 RepID=A0A364NVJ0_9PROT|nr:hypothetical protein [Paramagnetospirillum kuznetsovii]RAU21101.1 hypothetical protein CU669_15215 [Paramagnetospirillum kuznetsovii]